MKPSATTVPSSSKRQHAGPTSRRKKKKPSPQSPPSPRNPPHPPSPRNKPPRAVTLPSQTAILSRVRVAVFLSPGPDPTCYSSENCRGVSHTPSRQRISTKCNEKIPSRTNSKHVGAYRIRPQMREQARTATPQPHHVQTVNL